MPRQPAHPLPLGDQRWLLVIIFDISIGGRRFATAPFMEVSMIVISDELSVTFLPYIIIRYPSPERFVRTASQRHHLPCI